MPKMPLKVGFFRSMKLGQKGY